MRSKIILGFSFSLAATVFAIFAATYNNFERDTFETEEPRQIMVTVPDSEIRIEWIR